jgi:hypothetical protein
MYKDWKVKYESQIFRETLKGVDFSGVVETLTSEKDEIKLDGYRYVSKVRQRNSQIRKCSIGVAIFYKEKLYQWVKY